MVTTINLIALCCFVLIPVTIAGTAPAPANCSRTCSSGRGLKPGSTVNYPFGFSSGCPIQLSCDGDGNILIGEFPVLSVTADAVTITIPADCDRPFSLIDQLFRPNFAPTSRNAILLNNCTRSASCRLPSTMVNTQFESLCDGSSTLSCYSEELMYNSSGFINLKRLRAMKCQYLLSSISSEEYNGGLEALDMQMIQLGWWLIGECDCSENANCTEVLAPPYDSKGYRCRCIDGFVGDGFSTGGGCRRATGSGKKSSTKIVAITVPTVAAVAALLGLLCYWFSCRKRRQQDRERSAEIPLQQHMEGMSIDEEMQYFNLSTIVAATDGFSDANKLGEGGFGPVYKGKLLEGKEIAVKRLSMRSSQGMEEFKNEVVTIVKLQHRNLVRLFGCCIEGDERILVYEYLPNGSLDAFLFDPTKSRELEWTRRAQIVNGIARGLLYLHEDSRLKIIHRDLKASNVLLDDEMQPKISDFGTARIFGGSQIEANTARIVGTYGYMAPEYAMEGLFSVKSDVYSFGILVLEIISGKKSSGFYSPDRQQSLLSYAWQLWEENEGMELVDANLEKSRPINEALRWIHIALLCVQEDLNLRPMMSSVVLMLRSNSNLPQPKPPPSLIGRLGSDLSTSTGVGTGSLSSDVSITPGSCCEKIQQIRNTQ